MLRLRSLAGSALVVIALSCHSARPPAGDDGAPGDDTASIPFKGETLVFPPAPTRRDRRSLPPGLAAVDDAATQPIAVASPELDAAGRFELAGQTIRVRFTRPVTRGKDDPAPIRITPEVAGKATWQSDWSIAFTAEKPFDPEKDYAIEVGPVKDAEGNALPSWTATFRADPQLWIAGKLVSYIPEIGKPRVVALRPMDGTKVGTRPKLEVLFDQPVTASAAAPLVELLDETSTSVPVTVRRAGGKTFDGAKVDPGYVVVVTPKRALRTGVGYTLSVRDHDGKAEDASRTALIVADPLRFTEANCGWRTEGCSWSKGTLEIDGRDFTLAFNNTIADRSEAVESALEVSPPVKNLSVWIDRWSGDGRITVSGAFEPSTTYTVRLPSVRDVYGSSLRKPVELTVKTTAMPASVAMAEGVQFLDVERSRAFVVHSRNVDRAKLRFWEVEGTAEAWREANRRVAGRELPSENADVVVEVDAEERRDTQVETKVDLLAHLQAGKTYIAALELEDAGIAFSAPRPAYPSWSWASKPPVALVTVNDEKAIALHARTGTADALVHVSRLGPGDPLAGAKIFLDGKALKGVTTDAFGFAKFPLVESEATGKVLTVQHDGRSAMLVLGEGMQTQQDLVPELGHGATGALDQVRGLVISDRGVYRPGSTMHFKAMLRTPKGADLVPIVYAPVHFTVIDPTGKVAHEENGLTNDMGSFAASWNAGRGAEIGRYRAVIEPLFAAGAIASTTVQVAEFEPPRFKVDVVAKADAEKLDATVEGRYLFGAAMDGANVTWTLRRDAAPLPSGALTARGLQFRAPYVEDPEWTRTGIGVLDAHGKLTVDPVLEVAADLGPQRFTLEAEVTDSSHRAIAGRDSVVLHTAPHYAGVRLVDRWPDPGVELPIELGVIDQNGDAVVGQQIEATLVRLQWKRTRRPGPGGAVRVDWHEVATKVGSCTATSAETVVGCKLVPRTGGTYEVRTRVAGKQGGAVRLWVWGDGWDDSEPAQGHRLEVLSDKKSYAPGETAKLMVRNPFDEATAIFTVEQGAMLHTETRTLKAGAHELSFALKAEHAPRVHATVTLLPLHAKGEAVADWRFGATALPVALEGARLDVRVASDEPFYEPGQKATITVDVTRGGKAVKNAEVALAIVDEGVLRLTNFRVVDPVTALRPGAALKFAIHDTRRSLAEMLERSRVAGDGAEDEASASLVSTRKNFVQTALWRPDLRTDANGKASVELELPDNLTEFRMMAVVLDQKGRGGSVENSFEVRKPLMIVPAVPRFALVGDRYEAAVMVHNGQEKQVEATVRMGKHEQKVELAPRGHARVAFPVEPTTPGKQTLVFSVADEKGTVRDKVEAVVPVQAPGIDERPRLAGAFDKVQEIMLEVPAGVSTDLDRDAAVVVMIGHRMWPELGARLEYLVDYPHGCVEQTTSSTLPLLAARDILPRLGFLRFSKEQIDKMAAAGIERLASMKTGSGGLAYWPGGWEPNVYGTAYALRAVALAKSIGIEQPGLLEGMTTFLQGTLVDSAGREPEVRASVALALAEAGALPESSADMLMDTVPQQGVFGLANLALALSTLPGQEARVADLLGRIEASFDEQGTLVAAQPSGEFYYYGSSTRSKAQAALALIRLRPESKLVPMLVDDLVSATEGYTTQATAFGLLALREHIVGLDAVDAQLHARLDGVELDVDPSALGPGASRYLIPFEKVAGRRALLRLESSADVPVSYLVEAKWRRPLEAEGSLAGTSALRGPEIYRVYTDAKGAEVKLDAIAPGQVIRVALLGRLPESVESDRLGYLAMTDRIPAGFEPIQPDLWTVSRAPDLGDEHPMASMLRWGSSEASHVELRDDRVHLYFDRVWGEYVAGTYLMRATTPGRYTVPPAMGELMYEPDSTGYSTATDVTVAP